MDKPSQGARELGCGCVQEPPCSEDDRGAIAPCTRHAEWCREWAEHHAAERVRERDVEWQEHLASLHPDHTGDGCESGDPRDWTFYAIQMRLNELIDERDEADHALAQRRGEERW